MRRRTTARRVHRGRAEIWADVPPDERAHGVPDSVTATSNRPDVWPHLKVYSRRSCKSAPELHELLRIVAFMLFIVGTIMLVVHGFTGKTLMLHMVRLFVLTALLVMLPQWGNQVQSLCKLPS